MTDSCPGPGDLHGPRVAGQPAAVRLMGQVAHNTPPGVETPTAAQVGVVMRALADFTANNAALSYSPDPDEPGPHRGLATSLGRWHHAVADQLRSLDR